MLGPTQSHENAANQLLFRNDFDVCISQDSQGLIVKDTVTADYLVYVLKDRVDNFKKISQGSTIQGVTKKQLTDIQIPLPPLDIQCEIVAEIEGYQKVIDGARAVIDNYRPHIAIDPGWPESTIGEFCEVKGGKRLPKGQQLSECPTNHPYIRVSDFRDQSVQLDNLKFISEDIYNQIARYTISSANVYISIAGTIGMMGTVPDSLNGANLTENAAKLSFNESRIDKQFLTIVGNSDLVQRQIRSLTYSAGVPKLALHRIKMLRVPLPGLETQQDIVAEIEAEQSLVNANRELVTRMEGKIAATIGQVWESRE